MPLGPGPFTLLLHLHFAFSCSWVSGTYSIHHPFIWACCLRFIHSTAIQQRYDNVDLTCQETLQIFIG